MSFSLHRNPPFRAEHLASLLRTEKLLDTRHAWEAGKVSAAALQEVEVQDGDQWYLLRTALQEVAAKVLQAVGVAVPPPVRPLPVVPTPDPGVAMP